MIDLIMVRSEKYIRHLKSNIQLKYAKLFIEGHFDEQFYRFFYDKYLSDSISPIDHYLTIGRHLKFDPNPDFSTSAYFEDYPESEAETQDHFYLFLRHYRRMGRVARPSARKIEYVAAPYFDEAYYLSAYPDVRAVKTDPLVHYLDKGWREGRNPSPSFSTNYYIEEYPDVRAAGVNPLYHYALVGEKEGRRQSAISALNLASVGSVNREDDLLDHDILSRLVRKQPDITTKWLGNHYLAFDLPEIDRMKIFLHHYKYIFNLLKPKYLKDILFRDILIWSETLDDISYKIILKLAGPIKNEGELSLEFHRGEDCLYVLSFTIAPGDVFDQETRSVILVSRVQGMKWHFPLIKLASKDLKDVSPPFALMAALQGLAEALGIVRLVGVSGQFQASGSGLHLGDFTHSYDRFFETIGAVKASPRIFVAPLPLIEKPMSAIKAGHKLRTKSKRQVKRQISASACSAFSQCLAKAPTVETDASAATTPGLGWLYHDTIVRPAPSPERPALLETVQSRH